MEIGKQARFPDGTRGHIAFFQIGLHSPAGHGGDGAIPSYELKYSHGYRIVSGGTDNHLLLVDLRSRQLNGADASTALDEAGITVNKNGIPFDTGSPMKPSGIRIGTPAVTTRGMKEQDVEKVADFIHAALQSKDDPSALARIREEVFAFNTNFPLPGSDL